MKQHGPRHPKINNEIGHVFRARS